MNNFPIVNPNGSSGARETATVLNSTRDGKLNCLFEGTLTANADSTTFTEATAPGASRIAPDSFIDWMALTDNAADQKAATGASRMRVSARANGSVTITHANNSQNDRTFTFIVIGG